MSRAAASCAAIRLKLKPNTFNSLIPPAMTRTSTSPPEIRLVASSMLLTGITMLRTVSTGDCEENCEHRGGDPRDSATVAAVRSDWSWS